MREQWLDRQPSEVRLCEIDVDDHVFYVRGFGRSPQSAPEERDDEPTVRACRRRTALLWRRVTPYKIVRGFGALMALRRSEAGADSRVPAQFLEDFDPRPTFARAMLAACKGVDDLTKLSTLECSLALRRLRSHGSTDAEVREFLRGVGVPKRTAARARILARRLPEVFWESLKIGEMSLCNAEMIVRWMTNAGHTELNPGVIKLLSALVKSTTQRRCTRSELAEVLEGRSRKTKQSERGHKVVEEERPVWQFTRKKRVIVRRANLSIYSKPELLLRTAQRYRELAAYLESAAKRDGTGNHG